jgi:hypothetical protein
VHASLEYLYNQINDFKKVSYEELEKYFVTSFLDKSGQIEVEQSQIDDFILR